MVAMGGEIGGVCWGGAAGEWGGGEGSGARVTSPLALPFPSCVSFSEVAVRPAVSAGCPLCPCPPQPPPLLTLSCFVSVF